MCTNLAIERGGQEIWAMHTVLHTWWLEPQVQVGMGQNPGT